MLSSSANFDYATFVSKYGQTTAIIITIGILLLAILSIAGLWKILKKGGKPGWAAIIPIYNIWCLFEMTDINPLWSLITIVYSLIVNYVTSGSSTVGIISDLILIIIAIIMIVLDVKCSYRLSHRFGHGMGYALGLFLVPQIFQIILGFNSDQYQADVKF
jgi:hypothetical protein